MTDVDQFSSSTKIDQKSITKTPNGALQVSKPSIEVIGDFENSNDGWTLDSTDANDSLPAPTTSSQATRGSYHLEFDSDGLSTERTQYAERTVEVTGDKLKIDVTQANSDSYNSMIFRVTIDGTVVLEQDGTQGFGNLVGTLEFDVSGKDTADILIEHETFGDSGVRSYIFLDNLRFDAGKAVRENLG